METKDKIGTDDINNSISVVVSFDIDAIVECFQHTMREKGLTKTELAALADVPLPTLSKILDHTTRDPRFESVARIAKALNISLATLTDLATSPDASLPTFPADENLSKTAVRGMIIAYQQVVFSLREQIAMLKDQLSEKRFTRIFKNILTVLSVGGVVFYLVWDVTHPDEGMIQYQMYAAQGLSRWLAEVFTI